MAPGGKEPPGLDLESGSLPQLSLFRGGVGERACRRSFGEFGGTSDQRPQVFLSAYTLP